MKYLWIFRESNESWHTDSIFSCTQSKEKAQEIWDELKPKEGEGGSVYEYTVIDLENDKIIETIGRHEKHEPSEYVLKDER